MSHSVDGVLGLECQLECPTVLTVETQGWAYDGEIILAKVRPQEELQNTCDFQVHSAQAAAGCQGLVTVCFQLFSLLSSGRNWLGIGGVVLLLNLVSPM